MRIRTRIRTQTRTRVRIRTRIRTRAPRSLRFDSPTCRFESPSRRSDLPNRGFEPSSLRSDSRACPLGVRSHDEILRPSGQATSASRRFFLRASPAPVPFGSISPFCPFGARLLRFCSRSRAFHRWTDRFVSRTVRSWPPIDPIGLRSLASASRRFGLASPASIQPSLRTGASHACLGSIPRQFGSSSVHFRSTFTPERGSRPRRSSSDQAPRRESPRAGS